LAGWTIIEVYGPASTSGRTDCKQKIKREEAHNMNFVVAFLLLFGLVFLTGGVVGILRFPDFYTRLHPAGKLDTLGSLLMIAGMVLYHLHHLELSSVLVSTKMILIVVFIFLSSPTATHSIVDAGMRAGLRPWTREIYDKERKGS
jgi:multicomponent Na+:H+ antiporter subunit G